MRNKHSLKLIDGRFSASDAKEVLVNVFSSKIQFHRLKNFSSEERFGKGDEIALKRIPELKGCLEEIQKIIAEASENNQTLIIKSSVSIVVSTRKARPTKEKKLLVATSI